jgi:hypothetical protein
MDKTKRENLHTLAPHVERYKALEKQGFSFGRQIIRHGMRKRPSDPAQCPRTTLSYSVHERHFLIWRRVHERHFL